MAALTDVRAVLAQTGVIATVVAAEPLALLYLTVASVVLTVHPVLLAHQHFDRCRPVSNVPERSSRYARHVPYGRYTVFDDDGRAIGMEEFRCAPGPVGWRYFSQIRTSDPTPHEETFDAAVNADWRLARVRIATGEHETLLQPNADGAILTGYRDGRFVEIAFGDEVHVGYATPATSAITVRRLGAPAEIDVVYLEPATLEPSRRRHRYEPLGDERVATPVGAFDARRWRFSALDTGWTADLWVAGDIVVRFEGLFELAELDPGASGPRPVT